jgi:isopenicillin N synthase-like dioxygenase
MSNPVAPSGAPTLTDYRVDTGGLAKPPPKADAGRRPARDGEIPIIDVSTLDSDTAVRRMAEACERIGFLYVVGHDIPDAVVQGAFDQARVFFDQPEAAKLAYTVDAYQRGYRRDGTITVPGYRPDVKEVFELGVELAEDHPDVVAGKPMQGPNQWPPLPGFRPAMEAYFEAVSALGQRLLPGFARALDLPADFFAAYHREPTSTWRIMRYPPTPDRPGQFGTAPHTDFGTLTLLAQDDQGGLEVRLRSGEWIEAPSVPGSFIVNIGDLMACWTNDRFTSTAHRVINRSGSDRYSIPIFFNPGFETVVECLPSCHGPDKPPRYEPIHFGAYVEALTGHIFSEPAA